jgi:hypothetical protein
LARVASAATATSRTRIASISGKDYATSVRELRSHIALSRRTVRP